MSFRVEYQVVGNGGKWSQNGAFFATREEADAAGLAKSMAWTAVETYRVVEADEPPNMRVANGRVESIPTAAE